MKTRGSAVVVERDGRVLLLQRSPVMTWLPNRWNLPGGHIEPGEASAQTAARELFEEAGLIAQTLTPFCRARYDGHVIDVFHTKHWIGRVRLNFESVQYAWIPIEVAYREDLIPPQREILKRFARRN
jgi:8-oxo-dGTP pyrophosphatase MutT (NUDIX family)